ncbi:hypothetical protein OG962_19550 [Streptomyces platensis]|nr:hypothetical protein OG962_19550 [Streptomyces platensis]
MAGRADGLGEPTGKVNGGAKRRLRSQSGDSLRDLPDLRLILDGPKGSPDIFQAFHATPRVDAVFDEIGGLVRGVERTVQVTGLLPARRARSANIRARFPGSIGVPYFVVKTRP